MVCNFLQQWSNYFVVSFTVGYFIRYHRGGVLGTICKCSWNTVNSEYNARNWSFIEVANYFTSGKSGFHLLDKLHSRSRKDQACRYQVPFRLWSSRQEIDNCRVQGTSGKRDRLSYESTTWWDLRERPRLDIRSDLNSFEIVLEGACWNVCIIRQTLMHVPLLYCTPIRPLCRCNYYTEPQSYRLLCTCSYSTIARLDRPWWKCKISLASLGRIYMPMFGQSPKVKLHIFPF